MNFLRFLFKSKAMQTGPKGGKYYIKGGNKIYVDDEGKPQAFKKDTGGFKSPDGIKMYQKINSLLNRDQITNIIFEVDKLLRHKKITAIEANSLYDVADKRMKLVGKAYKKKEEKIESEERGKIIKKREVSLKKREESKEILGKKYSEKIKRIKPRFEKWKGNLTKVKKLEENNDKQLSAIENKIKNQIKPTADKLAERKSQIKKVSKTVTPGHKNYKELTQIIKKHSEQFNALKKEYESVSGERKELIEKKQKIDLFKEKALRILNDYAKQANVSKEIMLGKSIFAWI